MLYYLFSYLEKNFSIPGAGVFQYITFRMAMAVITSLIVTTVYGRRLIDYLRFKQVGETVRNLGLEGQMQKAGTPTMGGIIIILGILIPTLLFAKLENIVTRRHSDFLRYPAARELTSAHHRLYRVLPSIPRD